MSSPVALRRISIGLWLLGGLAANAASQDPRPCESKVKTSTSGGLHWTSSSDTADHCAQVQLSASSSISNGNGSKYARANARGRWSWVSCPLAGTWSFSGSTATRKWSAAYSYAFKRNCDGPQTEHRQPPPPFGGALTPEETGVELQSSLVGSATGIDLSFDPGAILFLGSSALGLPGESQRACLRLVVTDSRTNTVVFHGTITLRQDFGSTPVLLAEGHMRGQPIVVAPVPGGIAADLAAVRCPIAIPLEHADIAFETAAVGAEGDDGYVQAYGAGCAGSNGRFPALTASGLPNYGSIYNADLADVPPSSVAVLLFGASSEHWNGIPLPFPLDLLGAAGCSLLCSVDLTSFAMVGADGRAQTAISVPGTPTLLDAVLHHQYAVLDAPANALGLTFSNGLAVTLGGRR